MPRVWDPESDVGIGSRRSPAAITRASVPDEVLPTLTRQFGRKNQRCQAAPCRAGGGIGVRSRRRCRRGGAGISRKLTSRRVRLDRAGPPGTQCARGSLALERATIPTSGKRPVASDL